VFVLEQSKFSSGIQQGSLFLFLVTASVFTAIIDSMKTMEIAINNYLWGSKPEDVKANAKITLDGSHVTLEYDVIEKELRRMISEDDGNVWTDSCVEFFCGDGENYCNFEFSASGCMLAGFGSERKNRKRFSKEELKKVKREVTILENNNHQSHWTLKAELDLDDFGLTKRPLYFNMYKCGDDLKVPHFLSAFNIDLEKPDFHRPEFFQLLTD